MLTTWLGVADVLEAMPDVGRDLDELLVVLAEEELVHDALRGRALALVVEGELDHAPHADEVVGLELVIVPGLRHAGIHRRHVRLAEVDEEFVIPAEHLHEPAALVGMTRS
jgi:hypothetical protein